MSRNKVLKTMRESHCGEKVKHPTRIDAMAALARSLPPGQREGMEPYACKFCHGWHNGHPRIEALLEFDPKCNACGHRAMTHESGGTSGLGCFECDCTNSREYVYRRALRAAQMHLATATHRTRRAHAYVRALIAMMPRAMASHIRECFAVIARNFRRIARQEKAA